MAAHFAGERHLFSLSVFGKNLSLHFGDLIELFHQFIQLCSRLFLRFHIMKNVSQLH